MKKLLKKFSLIDIIIIILVLGAIIFAFVHITTDDSSDLQKTAFDASTVNKIPDTYSNYYKDGFIVRSTVEGYNASTGEEVTLNGTVDWIMDNGGTDMGLLIKSDNETNLVGLYKSVPYADIYINTVSLESDGSKYDNLVEFKIDPEKITSLNDLIKNIPNDTDLEISTTITLDSLDHVKLQEISNKLLKHSKRLSISTAKTKFENQISLIAATPTDLHDGDSIFGSINGVTNEITIRVYNCSDDQLKSIEDNYDVENIRKF